MRDDEDFARRLRSRLDVLAPEIDVDLGRVVPHARRRRAVHRSVAAAAVVAVAGTGWFGVASLVSGPAPQTGLPVAGSSSTPARVATSGEPDATASTLAPLEGPYGVPDYAVSADGQMTGAPGDPWPGDGLYWHRTVEQLDPSGAVLSTDETWTSRERPGLGMKAGDPSSAFAMGPVAVLGHFVIGGSEVDMLVDPAYLPRDPGELAAVLRATVRAKDAADPDATAAPSASTEDAMVYQQVSDMLVNMAGEVPADLADALWQVAAALPGAELTEGHDPIGRAGEVLSFSGAPGAVTMVRDAAGELLAWKDAGGQGWSVATEQGPTSQIPMQPTLELAGCVAWQSC